MSFSIQTNVNSLIAQENLRVNSNFQSQTIQRLTSGYRINSSGDDAAGLAIANKFRSDTAELTQGVRNANDGVSTLQIIDGGMNNISKMLDRLRTLSTQSASDTFTGDRNVVNSEFQSLLTEIDRQAQSIGLDTNGQFAKSLSVFVGGGKTAGTGALSTSNGTVSVDLSGSSVDTRALGLKGLQVLAGTADIGTGSSTHTVAQILADSGNTTATAGFTDMYFSGAGFSGSNKVSVSVNTSGVTDVTTLAAAINSAIQSAGNGSSQAATAFKNAGIVAGVHTDSSGGQQLSFTSSSAAFQVEAGDKMANAFLGNLSGTTGTAVSTTTVGANTAASGALFTPGGVTVRISGGGLSSAQDITFDSASTTTALALTDLSNKVNANAALKAAGITVSGTAGGALTFTSANGDQLNVSVTGDTANSLGFGTFLKGASSAADYSTLTAGAAYNNATALGTSDFEISLNGGASAGNVVSVNLDGGDATAASKTATADSDQHGNTITFSIDGGAATTVTLGATDTTAAAAVAKIQATAFTGVNATVNWQGYLQITSQTLGAHTLTIGGTNTYAGLNGTYTGTARTASSLVDALNAGFAADSDLSKAGLTASKDGSNVLTIASSNGTNFRLNVGGSTATTGNAGFGTAGTAAYAGPTVGASALSVRDASGATQTAGISFSALTYGNDDQSLTISANDSNGALQTKTISLQNDASARNGRSIDETVAYINTQLQQSNNATLQKIVAVKENNGGTEQINFISSLSSFSVGVGSSANGDGLNGGTAASENSALLGTGANVSIDSKAGALQAVAAVATAISTLGSAQAAVGKGQNQLNYAIGLAQSQISNFSAAESRIRDADVAAEAANLTKAQVLQQASMAAMAQANSAPQAVLTLLRG
ncbi:MAG: flagellin [Acidobacteriota bacterium]|nr:flagellin [Acidobacteriota bacterium]